MNHPTQPLPSDFEEDISTITCINSLKSCIGFDVDKVNSSCLIRTENNKSVYIDKYANVGINTGSPSRQLEIVSNDGSCLRMKHGISNLSTDIYVDENGTLKVSPEGLALEVDGSVKINNSTNSTSLNTGSIITDGGMSIVKDVYIGGDVNTTIPIKTQSGGNGYNSYNTGDLLTGFNNTLIKQAAPSTIGYLLTGDSTNGISYNYKYITNKIIEFVVNAIVNMNSYIFGSFYGVDSTGTINIAFPENSNYTINLNTFGVNGIGTLVSPQTGLIYPTPSSTTITGISTLFTFDIINSNVIISCNNETRRVVSIQSDTSLTIDTPFTILNSWSLGASGSISALPKFGTYALNCANTTTAYALLTTGAINKNYTSSNSKLWTLEFWMFIPSSSAMNVCASTTSNTFLISITNTRILRLSLGQGTSFNIANASSFATAITLNVYHHVAIVFTGTQYIAYLNGINSLTVNSTLPVSTTCFNSVYVGSNTTTVYNGRIDEFRISSIARYSSNFTVATSQFVMDANTISLQHFDNPSFTTSDDGSIMNSLSLFPYTIDTSIYPNTIYYGYAISSDIIMQYGYLFNSCYTKPQLPFGYNLFARIPMYAITDNANLWIPINYSYGDTCKGRYYTLYRAISLVNGATNISTNVLTTNISATIPYNTTKIDVLITHTHVGTTSCSISIGNVSLGMITVLPSAVAGTSQVQLTIPINNLSFNSYLSVAASTTNYTIQLLGFYT